MDIVIHPGKLSGSVNAIPSKSQAHRLLICAAFSDANTHLICPETNQDIEATAACLQALGANIKRVKDGYMISPIVTLPSSAVLDCAESGSTLRFLLPVIGALGVRGTFQMSGRLPQRPLSPLWEEMERMGCILTRPTDTEILCTGKLVPGEYTISGDVSSQFISGLLLAMAIMDGTSKLTVTGKLESQPYIEMTQLALSVFGVSAEKYIITGRRPLASPRKLKVEGDWSNAAFFLAANALGCSIDVCGLEQPSPQGDRAVLKEIAKLQQSNCTICAADIPDLIPVLSVVAAANYGAVFTDIGRLRLKESDRVHAIISMLSGLGIRTEADCDTLTVYPGAFHGGLVDSFNDHRIAMSAAVAAIVANGPVTIRGSETVAKSYPAFWEEYRKLGGCYEQYIW